MDTNVTWAADFVVMGRDLRTLPRRSTAKKRDFLRIEPSHKVNSVGEETTDQDIRDKYKELFNSVGLLKDRELKLNIKDLKHRRSCATKGNRKANFLY